MMHTRDLQDPPGPRTRSPPPMEVARQCRPATPVSRSTPVRALFVRLSCQIVNIRFGVFVCSCYLRLSVYTQHVCRRACVCHSS